MLPLATIQKLTTHELSQLVSRATRELASRLAPPDPALNPDGAPAPGAALAARMSNPGVAKRRRDTPEKAVLDIMDRMTPAEKARLRHAKAERERLERELLNEINEIAARVAAEQKAEREEKARIKEAELKRREAERTERAIEREHQKAERARRAKERAARAKAASLPYVILTCEVCAKEWQRKRQRGRPPKACPECKPVKSPPTPSDTVGP